MGFKGQQGPGDFWGARIIRSSYNELRYETWYVLVTKLGTIRDHNENRCNEN